MTRSRRGDHEGSLFLRPDGRWQGRVQLGGRRYSFYGDSKTAVRASMRKARETYEQHLDIETADTLLADYLNTWLQTAVRHKRDNTYRSHETGVRVHIIPNPVGSPLGRVALGKLRPAHVEAWIDDRRATGMAPTTLQRIVTTLRAGLNRAVKADILAKNPAAQVDPIHVETEEVRPLTQAEARRALAAADGSVEYALYAVALSLGLRIGELLGLRWRDVDAELSVLHVRSQMQHGQLAPLKRTWHRRTLVLSSWLMQVLEEHGRLLADQRQLAGQRWQEYDLVFPTRTGRPQRAANTWRAWKRLLKRAGLADTTFHNLRHTAASLALQANVPMWEVSRMLGHRDLATTAGIYAHLSHEGRQRVAEVMEQVLHPRGEGDAAEATGVRTGVQGVRLAAKPSTSSSKGVPGGE